MTLLALGGLLVWQQADPVTLERASLAQQAAMRIRDVVEEDSAVHLIELQSRFTRTDIPDQNSLLIVLYVQRQPDVTVPAETIRSRLRQAIQTRLREAEYDVTPLIDISVINPP